MTILMTNGQKAAAATDEQIGIILYSSGDKYANIDCTVHLVCVSYGNPPTILWTSSQLNDTINNSINRV